MKLHIFILIIIGPLLSISQSADSLIIRNSKSKKEFTILPWQNMIIKSTRNQGSQKILRKINCSIVKHSPDSIWIDATREKLTYSDTSNINQKDSVQWNIYDFNEKNFTYDFQKIVLAKNNCKSLIWIKRPMNRGIYEFLSYVSLYGIVASPLISINYKNGGFNTNRFFWTSGISMLSLTINFSLYKTAGVKRFNFTHGNYEIE